MTAKIMKEARAQNQDLEAEDNVMLQMSKSQQRQVGSAPAFLLQKFHSFIISVLKDGCVLNKLPSLICTLLRLPLVLHRMPPLSCLRIPIDLKRKDLALLLQAKDRMAASDSESEGDMLGDGQSEMWEEEEIEVSPEDEAAMAAFLNPMAKQRTLADIILEKIEEKQQRQALVAEG